MIDFKWNAFVKRMFLRDLGLSLVYVAAFTMSVLFRLEDENELAGALLGLIVTAGGFRSSTPHILRVSVLHQPRIPTTLVASLSPCSALGILCLSRGRHNER